MLEVAVRRYLPAAGGGPTVVDIDALGSEQYSAPGVSDVTYTNLTAGSSANGLVAVVVLANNTTTTITGETAVWDSGGSNQPMTLLAQETKTIGSTFIDSLVFGLRAPATGNKTLKIHWAAGSNECFMAAVSFTGVNQVSDAAAFPNQAITDVSSNVAVTSDAGHYAIAAFQANTIGTILGTTLFSDSAHGSFINAAADYIAGANPNVSLGLTSGAICLAATDISP